MKPLSIFRLLNSKVVLGIILLFTSSFANAATITSKATGNWSSAATWTPISRTGTISVTSGTKPVTGVGTSFTTELAVGSVLYRSNGTTLIGTVASITDDTHLTLASNAPATTTAQAYTAAVVPTASDDVIIASGNTVTVNVDAFAQSISVSGALNPSNGVQLTVYKDFTVNSTGSFTMPGGGGSATLLVYEDFLNNGTTDFWKSDVVIGGNLTTTTSALQNQGNIVVGGDITGNFNLTGGTGTNQIYATNPNATVTITPTSVDNNVPAGTYPSGESAALQALVNTVIYGGTCSFTVNNLTNITACTGSNVVFSVTTSGSAPSPTYQWQVNKNDGNGWSDLTNVTPYTNVTTSSLTISNVTAGMNNYQYRAKITASSCTINGNPGRLLTLTGSGNWLGATSSDWNTASNWCGGIPTASTDVVISSGTSFSPIIAAGTTALCNNLTINASATLTLAASATSVLNISGDFTNNGTFTAGTGSTVNYAGTAQSVADVTYSNLTTSGSGDKTLVGLITVNNNLYVGTGTRLIDNENQITGNATGTLTVENNATLFLGRIAASGTISTLFPTNFTKANIDLQTGSTVQYNSWVAQTISYVPDYYSIECQYPGAKSTSGAGTLTINGNLGTASVLNLSSCTAVNLSGDFNLWGAGATVTLPSPGTFSIKGNFNRDIVNSGGAITPGTGTVIFNGTAAQSMTGNGSFSFSFYNLTINNTSGGVGISTTTTGGTNDDITVSNTLTLTSGILTTSSTNLLNVTRTAVGAITGGSSTSFINGPVKWSTTTAASYPFPVGKGTTYLPFVLINATAPSGTPTAQVEAFSANGGGTADFSTVGSLSTTEYWSLVTTGTFSNTKVSLTRPTAIAPFDVIAGSTTVNGTYVSLAGTVGANGITTSSAIGTNRFFVFGRKNGIRTSAITGSPFCQGASVSVPYTVTGTYAAGNVYTAQLSDASGSFTSPVNIGSLTRTTAGTITATIPAGSTAGTGYRIRVVASTTPQTVGSDNGTDLIVKINTAGTASSTPTICISVPMTSITHATTGATGIGVATGLPTGVTASWAFNTITISGTPTASGIFNYSIPLSGGCGSVNATGTITVNLNATNVLTSAAGTAAQTLCNNTAITNIVYTVANAGTGASITAGALPTGVTGTFSGSTFTISGTPTALGTFNYTVTTGGCSPASLSGTIIVNPCVYTWKGNISSDWSIGGNWSDGAAPGVGDNALIPFAGVTNMPVITGPANAKDLTIQSGSTLTVTSPGALSVKGAIVNNGTLSGTGTTTLNGTLAQTISGTGSWGNITHNNSLGCTASSAVTISGILTLTSGQFTSNGNLTVDLNTGAIDGSGTGTILGTITTTKNISSNKYHMVSCPLSGLTANDWNDDVRIQSGTYSNLYSYDETNTDTSRSLGWIAQTSLAAPLSSLTGFALYFTGVTTVDETGSYTHSASYSTSTLTNTVSTVGASHNAGADGWNLVGNPYPSALDWSSASGWTKTGLDNAIYCWDPVNSRYTSYVAGIGTNGGTQYIPSMQGFWIKVTNPGSGTLAMNNNVRVTSTNPSTWRTASLSNILKLTASSGAYRDETIIRFREDALSIFDSELDAYKMDNEDYTPTLYTEDTKDQYSVNSLPYPSKDTSISVKLRAAFNGSYTFNADGITSFSSKDSIIFEDRLLGIKQDLRSNPAYTCSLIQGDTTSRFYIRFRKGNEITSNSPLPPSISVRGLEDQIDVNFFNETSKRATISIYNTLGEQVFKIENADISSKEYSIKSSRIPNGIFIVKVLTDSQTSSRKVYLVK